MNYFAHGLRFTDRPWFLAGVACPDWLSAFDRKVRLRKRHVAPFADQSSEPCAEFAAGVLQHLRDDESFHASAAFYEVSGQLTRLFREALGPEDGYRTGFLGHIACEMLLDAVLIERQPDRLDGYYSALATLEPSRVEECVNRMAPRSTDRLVLWIPRFISERFLLDYLDSSRFLYRLNQVLRRVKLGPLPAQLTDVIDDARSLVADRTSELLPYDLNTRLEA